MVVLLVEDEEKIASFIKKALEYEQYTVETAADGEEAVNKISVNDYDLVVLDIMLPKKDGFKVCEEVRMLGLTVPILMLTARDQQTDKVTGLNLGADDYLVKPFEMNEFLARIRALLRRKKVFKPAEMKIGDLVLDSGSHEVKRNGKSIHLTSKEYRILEFLMNYEGLVCSRTMINEHVWGFNYVKSNIIDVYVSRLRQKIDGGFDTKLLHTIRKSGYKLKA